MKKCKKCERPAIKDTDYCVRHQIDFGTMEKRASKFPDSPQDYVSKFPSGAHTPTSDRKDSDDD